MIGKKHITEKSMEPVLWLLIDLGFSINISGATIMKIRWLYKKYQNLSILSKFG